MDRLQQAVSFQYYIKPAGSLTTPPLTGLQQRVAGFQGVTAEPGACRQALGSSASGGVID